MKANSKIKLIALSVSLLASSGAPAALGGLRVNSGLGEPFSGTVTITGKEAKELLKGTKPAFSDGRLKANVRKSGNDAVVSLSSAAAIKDPVIVFQMSVKGQSRQYTAVLDPASPKAKAAVAAQAKKDEKKEEAAKPAREEQSKAKEEAAAKKEKAAEAAKAQKPSEKPAEPKQAEAKTAEPGRHTVQSNETLFIIADQLRPDNMSPDQAVRALIKANPKKLGGNPNRLLAGTVLTLPAGFKPSSAMSAVPSENAEAAKAPVEKAKPQPEAPKPEAAPEAAKPEPETVPDEAENSAMPPQEQDAQTSEPAPAPVGEDTQNEQPAAPAQTQEPVEEEGEGGSFLWKWVLAGGLGLTVLLLLAKLLLGRKSASKTAAAEDEESPFDQQDGIRLHQPVAKPEKPKAPITKNQAAENEFIDDDIEDDIVFFDNAESGPIESAADFDLNLGALDLDQQQVGIMSSAVTDDEETRRRANADWDSIESTESVFEPDEFAVKKTEPAPQPAAPAPAAAEPAAVAVEEVVFAEPAADIAAPQAFEPEAEAFAVQTAAAEEEPAAVSWATAEFARPETALEAEPPAFAAEPVADVGVTVEETVSWAGTGGIAAEEEPLAFAVEEFAVEPQAAAEPAPAAFVGETVQTASADEAAPLDFDFESVAIAPAAEVPETIETPVAEPEPFAAAEPALDFAPPSETLEAAFPNEAAEAVETVVVEEPALAFDMQEVSFDAVEAPAEPVQTADQPAADLSDFGLVDTAETIAPAADLSGFDVAETVETVAPAADLPDFGLVETVKAAAPVGDFAAFAEPEPAAEVALQIEPEAVGVAEAEPLADPFAAAELAAEPVAEAPQAPAGDWQDDAEIGLADTVTFDDAQLESADDLVIDWGSLDAAQAASEDKPAFVSESVGMTAPLEAKYELAEMYIEIGDPDAARETLYELIEESSGEIQAKSKALLAGIGG
ncbi:FimV/HubP family polar landmark protein [Neisseria sp. 23W00296]|uniref:FimV/HubP family polar landmark protein n=1 Tax=unclassified Neisseria TaxID=2623750 RepID=UPI0012FDE5F0|nr:FimV/HubP family polar landmark protein [Neisseria sp. KEM232]